MDPKLRSVHEPLLLTGDGKSGYAKKTFILVSLTKWVFKVLMWVIFVSWVTLIFLYPLEFVQALFQKWVFTTGGNLFGITGSVFLVFSGPVIILALLSATYLIASPAEEFHKKKNPKFPRFRLWTFPVLVDGPFGVVSAAEVIGILLFAVYILWSVSVYTIRNQGLVSKYNLPWREASSLMLELSGVRFGSIGLFCLAFLFIPVTRGSVLLRLIDIPFEHATRYHVWLGHLTMLIFTLHGVFYVVAWALQGRLIREMLQWKDIGVANLPGVISLLAGLLMWATSFHPVRKQYFELFFYTHQLYIIFIVFLALHVGDSLFSIAAGGIFLFLLDRFLRFCQSRKTVDIMSATCLPCGTVELVISKPRNLQYNALSFVFLQVRELSWLQWHPFSVSSSPLDGSHHLSVLIKVLGDWTRNLRDNISETSDEHQKESAVQLHPRFTASVEGPYGHESAYHLMYENLILVAGGIGISPFLAILSDIFHRIEEKRPCLPQKVLVVWAVKKSKELHLLSAVDLESICPSFSNKLHLDIKIYVTQELEPALEDGVVHKSISHCHLPAATGSNMSGLVGTGNNVWSGIYLILSTIGFITFLALTNLLYIKPFGITCWWFKGLLFLACMTVSIITFGGLVVVLWHLQETRDSASKNYMEEDDKTCNADQFVKPNPDSRSLQATLGSVTTTQHGHRPDFRGIFNSASERWGRVDVGVIVCGPPPLQSSVAKECRSQNLKGERNQPVFHFNSHSFDL